MTILSLLIFLVPLFTSPAEVAANVIESDRRLNELILQHDAANASAFYAEEFVLRVSTGGLKNKAEMVQEIADPDIVWEINETETPEVIVLENTAILTGVLHQKFTWKGKAYDAKLYITDTWVNTGKGWTLLAGHASVVPD